MNEHFLPISGTEGIFQLDSEDWPASRWALTAVTEQIPIGTVASCPFFDVLPGWTTGSAIVSGIVRRGFNPNLSNRNTFQGSYHNIKLYTTLGSYYEFPSAMIVRWEWGQTSNEVPTFACLLVGNWKFYDFSGGQAQ